MGYRRSGPVTLLLLMIGAPSARAQVCSGEPTFAGATAHLFARVGVGPEHSGHVGVVLGGSRLFGLATAGLTTFRRDQALELGLGAAVQLPRHSQSRLQVCPQTIAVLRKASNVGGTTISYDELTFATGVEVGYALHRGKSTQIAPTVSLHLVTGVIKFKFIDGTNRTNPADAFSVIAGGVGFQVNEQATLSPSVSLPIGQHGIVTPTYSVTFSLRFVKGM